MTIPIGELCPQCRAKVRSHNRETLATRRAVHGKPLIRRVPVRRAAEHITELQAAGWTYPKVAAEVGCSVETIKRIMRLYRRGDRRARCWDVFERAVLALEP